MTNTLETATLAGGCFWCTEAIFRRLKGVEFITSGYAGKGQKPTFEKVSKGEAKFVEAIQIKFNPNIISFEHLLDIFWATHDPTTLNRQDYDIGLQYRSAIFYHTNQQKQAALKSKQQMEKSKQLNNKIVTAIEPFTNFYTAEEYHQKYYETYKDINPYCSIIIDPKIEKILTKFNSDVKEEYK